MERRVLNPVPSKRPEIPVPEENLSVEDRLNRLEALVRLMAGTLDPDKFMRITQLKVEYQKAAMAYGPQDERTRALHVELKSLIEISD